MSDAIIKFSLNEKNKRFFNKLLIKGGVKIKAIRK